MRLTRVLSLCVLPLVFALPAQSAVSVVQSRSANVAISGTAVSLSFASNTTAGNLIAVACLSAAAYGSVSVSDNATPANSYTTVAAYNVNSALGGLQWLYAKNISGGTDTVTCTFQLMKLPSVCLVVVQLSLPGAGSRACLTAMVMKRSSGS